MQNRIISASLSPNAEKDDVLLALKNLLMPWTWRDKKQLTILELWFNNYFPDHDVFFFNSGRSAELALFTAFGIGSGDEVLVQAFTCVAVPNSVIWAGAKPIFVDVDQTLNIDLNDAGEKITRKTKAIIVQHTFGTPAEMDKVVSFARKHKLILIEDCAHALGANFKNKKIGSFGDAAFFSFGRDKVLSSVFGGAGIINSKLKSVSDKLRGYQENLPEPNNFWIFQQLLHPVAFSIILPLYDVGIGKLLLVVLQHLRLLSFPVYKKEREGMRPTDFPAKYPAALAALLNNQISKLGRYNENRREIARFYRNSLKGNKKVELLPERDGSIYLRFPIFVDNPEVMRKRALEKGVLLGNWYHNVIDPTGVNFDKIGYKQGSCPRAEEISKKILNLPTRINLFQAERVIEILL